MDYYKESVELHKKKHGKIEISSKVSLDSKDDLSLAYTPGVAEPCRLISKDPSLAYGMTIKGNSVAVITDGSAVLGLGNIGPLAGLPVMEGKALLFKEFGGVDAYPLCLSTNSVDQFIDSVKSLSVGFGGINLEDIKAPECFIIEERLSDELDIPVFHDDQHGTAIVVLAALLNSSYLVGKPLESLKVVVTGAGAAGIAISHLLIYSGVKDLIIVDSKGVLLSADDSPDFKKKTVSMSNPRRITGGLSEAMIGADVFIGVSAPNILSEKLIRSMGSKPIIFAMANPDPEIMPDIALGAGAFIVGTGRSDFPNQINNLLAFPGIFRGLLDARIKKVSDDIKVAAAKAIASSVTPSIDRILPSPLDKSVPVRVAEAVKSFK